MEKRGQLWVYGNSAFILQIPDFDVKTFDLSIELNSISTIAQRKIGTDKLTKVAAFSLRPTFSS